MKNLCIFISILFGWQVAAAQVPFWSSIKKMPSNYDHPSFSMDVSKTKKGKIPWVVFSDSDNNPTYTSAAGVTKLKEMQFMQPFYVIGEKGDFLELIKFDPSVYFKKFGRYKVKNRLSAVYYGWVPKSRLLLWRKAMEDPRTHFPLKAIVMFNDTKALYHPTKYFFEDSLKISSSSSMSNPKVKDVTQFSIVYIYKTSDDGSRSLIGRTSQLTQDNYKKAVIGWVPSATVQKWGTHLFITPINDGDVHPAKSTATLFFHRDANGIATNSGIDEGKWKKDTRDYDEPTLRGFPVLNSSFIGPRKNEVISTGIPVNVFDNDAKSVVNLNGQSVSYKQYLQWRESMKKVNMIFVVDGSAKMSAYLPPLINVFQHLQPYFDSASSSGNYSFGAVVYRDAYNCNATSQLSVSKLTPGYTSTLNFLAKKAGEASRCNDTVARQPVYTGLYAALQMLKDHQDETNVIVLVGGAGNQDNRQPGQPQLINLLSQYAVRLLVFQTNNDYTSSYADFVLEGKNLVLQSAAKLSGLRKEKMVNSNRLVTSYPQFVIPKEKDESNIYFLDYPNGSMEPGAVLFPRNGEVLSIKYLQSGITKLMKQITGDNVNIIRDLHYAFNNVSIFNQLGGTLIDYLKNSNINNTDSIYSAFTSYHYKFYIPCFTSAAYSYDAAQKAFNYALLLSEDEYYQLRKTISDLALEGFSMGSPGIRRRFVRVAKRMAKRRKHLGAYYKGINKKTMTLAQEINLMDGYPSNTQLLNAYSISDLKRQQVVSDSAFSKILDLFKSRDQSIKGIENDPAYKFQSNGETYYWIPASILP